MHADVSVCVQKDLCRHKYTKHRPEGNPSPCLFYVSRWYGRCSTQVQWHQWRLLKVCRRREHESGPQRLDNIRFYTAGEKKGQGRHAVIWLAYTCKQEQAKQSMNSFCSRVSFLERCLFILFFSKKVNSRKPNRSQVTKPPKPLGHTGTSTNLPWVGRKTCAMISLLPETLKLLSHAPLTPSPWLCVKQVSRGKVFIS